MTDRRSTEDRRREVVDAALALLADQPLEQLSTRQLARALGLSQPALFRHFRSREGILLAVVERARADLMAAVAAALAGEGDPVGQLRALVRTLLESVEARPGLPRLLFSLASPVDSPVRTALLALVASQRRLMVDRIVAGQRGGAIEGGLDAGRAATHLAGLVQGVIFQWVAGGRPPGLAAEAGPLMALWLGGVKGDGTPMRAAARAPALVWVDGRALLGRGIDPLAAVLGGMEGAGPGSVLRFDAPFRPGPLIELLRGRGLAVEVEALGKDHHALLARVPPTPPAVDLRDLEAPEPLERVLLDTAGLAPGASYLARTPRAPRLLLGRLAERGIGAAVHEEPDGSALLLCWRDPA
jgi:TetR/AcrR family transcriptional regulator